MQPTVYNVFEGGYTPPEGVNPLDLCIPGSTLELAHVVVFNGHTFEAARVNSAKWKADPNDRQMDLYAYAPDWSSIEWGHFEYSMSMYAPIDERTNLTDWHGAIGAKPNADNDGWLPIRTDKGTHHDPVTFRATQPEATPRASRTSPRVDYYPCDDSPAGASMRLRPHA